MPVRLRDDVTLVATDYGAVLLDERAGRYYQLNPTGQLAAEHLLAGHGTDEIVAAITAAYDVTDEHAGADLLALVDQLRAAGLVIA
ncbi:lasso peptide biosynthesis PqqD family chaperone [Kitasatospora sp. NPDC093806]|uniref:lasso peptide biosynthesis PqqD family chaperone n=1 Tax=Kitasatospora sp. NPDC093806 TaxID=3155075 RepID=UPI00344ACDBA